MALYLNAPSLMHLKEVIKGHQDNNIISHHNQPFAR